MSRVGIFDSGLGGLTVWSAIRRAQPSIPCLYLADQAHLPYGPRGRDDIQALAAAITRAMVQQDVKLIVLACNTASAAALKPLREQFPSLRFVGMEPAVKPAALSTRSGVVGLMATRGTLQGELLRDTAQRFANEVKIISSDCPGLAEAIEQGRDDEQLLDMLTQQLQAMKQAGVDTVVLGCTHYPLIAPLIHQVFEHPVQLIDPAPAVARQVARLWQDIAKTDDEPITDRFATTALPQQLQQFLATRFNHHSSVETWSWNEAKLTAQSANP